MTKPGPKERPRHLQAVEGNPGKKSTATLSRRLKLPPGTPPEPRWTDLFPLPRKGDVPSATDRALIATDVRRARTVAAREWARVVPVLGAAGILATIDEAVLADYCATVAQVDGARRDIARRGAWIRSERGAVKNPSVTALNQYRAAMKTYIGELGLAPASRNDLTGSTGAPSGAGSEGGAGATGTGGASPFDV